MGSTGNSATAALLSALNELKGITLSDTERNELVVQLRTTLNEVQSPWQRMQALVWENSGHAAALKTAHDIGLFTNWPENQDVASLDQLSQIVRPSTDPILLGKVLNALSYKGTLCSPQKDQYALTEFAKALREPSMAACLDYWFDFQIPALSNLPGFLQKTSYQLPLNPANTAWNLASNDPTPFFGWLQQRPEKLGKFAQVMQRYSASQPPWTSIYPTETLLSEPLADGAPLVVDVGGSLGHDITKFVEKHQPPPGSCYLQDKAEVIEKATINEDIITPIAHDFFQPQPIKGARAYYLHNILHDWPDAECQTILGHLKAALTPAPDASEHNSGNGNRAGRILIHEIVGREDAAHDLLSVGEFTVMAILGAPERTEAQYRALIEAAGLRLMAVHAHPLSLHSIIEIYYFPSCFNSSSMSVVALV